MLARIWQLSWPVVISQSLVSAVGLIDLAMLGGLGPDALAAVGYAAQFYFLVNSVLNAVGAACVALMARAAGAGDERQGREAFAACLAVALGIGTLVTAIAWSVPASLLQLVDAPASVIALGVPYFCLTLGAAPLAALYVTHEHAFRAQGDTRTPLAFAASITVVKVALNWLLIDGHWGFPRLDLMGAAFATILAQAIGVVLFRWRCARTAAPALRIDAAALSTLPERTAQVARVAWPSVAEYGVMHLAIMLYFKFLGQYGLAVVAAYSVGVRVLSFSWMPGIGLSVAAATLVGQALGAGDPERARQTGARAARLSLAISSALGLGFILLRRPLASIFTRDPDVLQALDSFLLLLGLAQPFLCLHFTLSGALRGAGDTLTPLFAALLGNWMFRVPLAFLFARLLHLDIIWVWAIMITDHLSRALLLSWAFRRGHWQHALQPSRRTQPQRPALAAPGSFGIKEASRSSDAPKAPPAT